MHSVEIFNTNVEITFTNNAIRWVVDDYKSGINSCPLPKDTVKL